VRPGAPVLRIGTSGDYPPFSVVREGEPDGLDVQVLRRFARDSGRRLEIVPLRWPELIRDLEAGRFALAVGGVTLRPERAVAGIYTRPVARAGAVVLAHPGVLPDRPGVRLAVNAGGHLERLAARLFPRATLVSTGNNRALPHLVASGAADALLTDELEATAIRGELRDAVRFGPFTCDAKAYLGRDPALVAELDAWLRAREADGALARLRARWLGPARAERRTAFASDLDAILALVDLRLAFMPAVAAAKRAAGRSVEDQAQETRVLVAVRTRAAGLGLAPASAEALFRVLFDAARMLEHAFLAHPWVIEPLDLEREARPALARVSDGIVARAADLARDPEALGRLDAHTIAESLDSSLAPAEARLAIARAVVALRPTASTVGERTGVCKRCKRTSTPLEAGPRRARRVDRHQKSRANSKTSAVSLR
jgi:cyclohexadienyl dehydratase